MSENPNEGNKKDNHTKTVDELLEEMIEHFGAATKNLCDGMDKIADALVNASPSEVQKIANALAEVDFEKKSSPKKGLLNRLLKTRGKKIVAMLATLGVILLGNSLRSNEKQSTGSELPKIQQTVPSHTTQDKTLNVLDALIKDPHAFDGIEIKDSMESDCVMMNKKMLDALDGALKRSGYLDENGNLKPMRMVDVSNADALGALKGGLKAPSIYTTQKTNPERR